jgi:hypothetical protein
MKYLPFETHAAAKSFSHALCVQRGHDPESKDMFFRVIPAPSLPDKEDTGAYLQVPEELEYHLDDGLKAQLLDETAVEPGDTFPVETMQKKDGSAPVAGAPTPAPQTAPEPAGETYVPEPAPEPAYEQPILTEGHTEQ